MSNVLDNSIVFKGEDLTGKTFGRWRVIAFAGYKIYGKARINGQRHALWECICSCGTTRVVFAEALRTNASKSCGCLQRELLSTRLTTHGLSCRTSKHPIYSSWLCMKQRCTNPKVRHFRHYGGRGITVCERWKSFENFYEDMSGSWTPGLSLDRKDTDGHYEPGNCKWSTQVEQVANQRPYFRAHFL